MLKSYNKYKMQRSLEEGTSRFAGEVLERGGADSSRCRGAGRAVEAAGVVGTDV